MFIINLFKRLWSWLADDDHMGRMIISIILSALVLFFTFGFLLNSCIEATCIRGPQGYCCSQSMPCPQGDSQ